MSRLPRVSVIIPVFNLAPYVAETLDSLFRQTYADFEAIVVNDGSTDRTEEALEPFRGRIVYRRQENRGVMAARNAGLRIARGELIALLDGDDLWMPDCLRTLVGMLDADSGADVAFPNAVFFGSPRFDGRLHQEVFAVNQPITFDRLLRRETHVFGSLVFRRRVLTEIGEFDESLAGQGAEDYDLWLRMLRHGCRFIFTSEPLVKYRWRSNSLSNSGVGLLRCLISVYDKLLRRGDLTVEQDVWVREHLPRLSADLHLARFREALRDRRDREAREFLARANDFFQRPKLSLLRIAMRISPALVRFVDKICVLL